MASWTETNNASPVAVSVEATSPTVRQRGWALAEALGLPLVDSHARPEPDRALLLVVTPHRLELRETKQRGGTVYADFVGGATGYRRVSGRSRDQLIGRAIGRKHGTRTVADATAGLCRDTFLLACLGCRVTAMERSAVVAALVRDGIERGKQPGISELTKALERITLRVGDARELLPQMTGERRPDVVYIDPMYPESRGRALSKKEMRVLRKLVGDDRDASELLEAARAAAGRRVVVKRHRHAPPIAPEPDIRYRGRAVRYDVYVSQPG